MPYKRFVAARLWTAILSGTNSCHDVCVSLSRVTNTCKRLCRKELATKNSCHDRCGTVTRIHGASFLDHVVAEGEQHILTVGVENHIAGVVVDQRAGIEERAAIEAARFTLE